MMDALPLHDARKAGIREGMALGEAKGEKKGRLAGERNAKFETAKKMLENKIPIALITKCTGLSLEEVNSLKKE